ncbi:hypothetical protein BIW11_10896 [Tropilaelaps mercedesae]|uniref:Uncharacterized protein n=1 Tax=Tropilaelaps mercedesae TaxID=418985 RepID=A0A1V9XDN9_9ACAR|nr:hypothetical protein BIW11_10896 [Tropilaelaps mercedesae]
MSVSTPLRLETPFNPWCLPHVFGRLVADQVDLRDMPAITVEILQWRILHYGHKIVKRARKRGYQAVTFRGETNYEVPTTAPDITIDVRHNPSRTALTFPRACALASLSVLKSSEISGIHNRKPEIANIINFGCFTLARRCCVSGARYLGKFIAQEMPDDHPAHIERVGSHPSYGFVDGDLGQWLAAFVIMDYTRMRSRGELQHFENLSPDKPLAHLHVPHPLYDFYLSENVEPKYRKVTLDAVTYMGWSGGDKPISWSELIDKECENGVRISAKDRETLERVLRTARPTK